MIILPRVPAFVQFETSTKCGGNCVNCPNSHRTMEKDGTITGGRDKLVKRGESIGRYPALLEIKRYPEIKTVAPFLYEDPFLQPDIIDTLRTIRRMGKGIILYSALAHVDTMLLKQVVTEGLAAEIHVSHHGYDRDSWRAWHGGSIRDYADARANISYLASIKHHGGYTLPRVILNTINIPDNTKEAKRIRGSFTDQVDDIWFVSYDDFHGTFPDLLWRDPMPSWRTPCQRLWTSLNILSDGNVTPCCLDYAEEMVIGNIKDQTLEEIYHGDKAQKWRDDHLNGVFRGPCATCKAWYRYANIPWVDWCHKEGYRLVIP